MKKLTAKEMKEIGRINIRSNMALIQSGELVYEAPKEWTPDEGVHLDLLAILQARILQVASIK